MHAFSRVAARFAQQALTSRSWAQTPVSRSAPQRLVALTLFAVVAGLLLTVSAGAAPAPYVNAVLADSPVAYWRLGEAPGATTAVDATGHGNNGTYNGVTLGTDSGLETDANTSATFSSGSWANVGDAGGFDGGDFTVEAWISTITDDTTVMYRPDSVRGSNWSIGVDSTGRITAQVVNPDSPFTPLFFGGAGPAIQVDDGAWHHMVVSNDAAYIRIWVDGVEQDTAKVVQECPKAGCALAFDPPAPTTPVRIGNGFVGDVDEVAVYNHVLSNARMNAHYTSGETYSDASDQPSLTDSQRAQATSIVTNDPRFLAIAGPGYTVSTPTAWVKLSGGLIGAEVDVTLGSTQTITTNWPDISYDDTESMSPPYSEGTDHETYTGVSGLTALVDLNRAVMVSMMPDGAVDDPPDQDLSANYNVNGDTGDKAGYDSSLRRFYIDADWFWSFDFSTDHIGAGSVESRSKVDMPVNLIWWSLADVNKAKDALAAYGFHHGCSVPCGVNPYDNRWGAENEHMRLKDGRPAQDPLSRGTVTHTTQWDGDRGAVQGYPVHGLRHHYRLYAPAPDVGGDDRMYNIDWGYYVVSTSHLDRDDHCSGPGCHSWSGKSEDAERFIRKKAIAAGLTVNADAVNLRNGHDARPLGRKRFQNNGLATKIRLN
jgi:hypothetical protein